MPNHGYCKNCWWEQYGKCYFHMNRVNDRDYCPDYTNRKKHKDTLADWIEKNNIDNL